MASKRRLPVGLLVFVHDTGMAALAFLLALWLRVGELWTYPWEQLEENLLLFTLVCAVSFRARHLYRGVWRYASLNDLIAIAQASTLAVASYSVLTFLITRGEGLPRSLPVIAWLVLMLLLGGPRMVYRLFKDGRLDFRAPVREVRQISAILVGAGDSAEVFVRQMARPDAHYRVLGILDVDASRVGYRIHGVEVLGPVEALAATVEALRAKKEDPQRIILSADLPGSLVRSIFDAGDALGLVVSRLPKITELRADAQIEVRPIAIEDLLNRPEANLDRQGMARLIEGRRVLVTGAGGSIGSELVRQICSFGPSQLALLDNGEYALYTIDQEVAERWPNVPRATVLADVRDRERIFAVCSEQRPDLVFHAAALKHVPMVEAHPSEGVLTNVNGTRNVADAARAAGVAAMVMISTDKAVNPTNVMGATKRAAEGYCQALDIEESRRTNGMRFITVRFGNVLGSTGSVVPLFTRQLARGGPLTVTHAEIERYFMTIREAVALVLQAAVLRLGVGRDRVENEGGRLFVLDMGEPVKIVDLARQMIRLAGLRPGEDVRIEITGLRPGEKLKEELFHHQEELVPTAFAGINAAAPRVADFAVMARALDGLIEVARTGDDAGVVKRLRAIVPEYAVFADPPSAPYDVGRG